MARRPDISNGRLSDAAVRARYRRYTAYLSEDELREELSAIVDSLGPLAARPLKTRARDALRTFKRKEILDDRPGLKALDPGKEGGVTAQEHVKGELTKYSPRGRTLRKAFERPRPDLPADAPENRTRKIVSLTLPPDLIAEVSAEAEALGVDRSSFIEHAIRAALGKKLSP